MKKIALLGIRAYQRWISPYKGFHCAFHAHTKRQTCSGYGYRVIARYGTVNGYLLLRRRMQACTAVHAAHHSKPELRQLPNLQHRQRGDCDLPGCDLPGCDLPGCDLPGCNVGKACDVLEPAAKIADCCSGCDSNENRRHKSARRQWTEFLIILLAIIILIILIAYAASALS